LQGRKKGDLSWPPAGENCSDLSVVAKEKKGEGQEGTYASGSLGVSVFLLKSPLTAGEKYLASQSFGACRKGKTDR